MEDWKKKIHINRDDFTGATGRFQGYDTVFFYIVSVSHIIGLLDLKYNSEGKVLTTSFAGIIIHTGSTCGAALLLFPKLK